MGVLEGSRAVVTGGASGIGQAIATAFAAEGADVTIFDRADEDRLSGAAPARAPGGRQGARTSRERRLRGGDRYGVRCAGWTRGNRHLGQQRGTFDREVAAADLCGGFRSADGGQSTGPIPLRPRGAEADGGPRPRRTRRQYCLRTRLSRPRELLALFCFE